MPENTRRNRGSTFYSLHYHVVFSTKERRPFIRSEWRSRLHEYLGGTVRGLGGVAEAVGGVEDHVHLLVSLKTIDAPAEFVRELKKASSIWVAQMHDPRFSWQEGYSIFSASWMHVPALRRYIGNQQEHHKKRGIETDAGEKWGELRGKVLGLRVAGFSGTPPGCRIHLNADRRSSRCSDLRLLS